MDLPFRTLAPWLRDTFGRPVFRVALDAGSTCPNRDGKKGLGGCVYCDVEGSGSGALREGASLSKQLETGLTRIARRRRPKDPAIGAIAYFQSYTNTYVSTQRLIETLEVVRPFLSAAGSDNPEDNPERNLGGDLGSDGPGVHIAAISVATRPDCLPEAALDVLTEWAQHVPVWVELGLEVADDQRLIDIGRMHTVQEFYDAVERVHERGLMCIGHAILGLPDDGRQGARETAQALAAARCSGVKVHNLMVLKRTQLASRYKAGLLDVLDADTYVDWLADFVERLHPDQILHRITGDAPEENRLAPHWNVHKTEIRERLAAKLTQRQTRQGSHVDPAVATPIQARTSSRIS